MIPWEAVPVALWSLPWRETMWLVTIFASFYFAYIGGLFAFQEHFLYFPSKEIEATPDDAGFAYEEIAFRTGDGVRLSAWYLPAKNPRGTVLFCHGNAGNISHRLDTIPTMLDLGLSVFIFDYRGYGRSEGRPGEGGLYRDVLAAWNYLTRQRDVAPEEIVIWGRSLGGGVASWLAEVENPAGLVLESTFTSIPDVAATRFPLAPVHKLSRNRFETLARMEHIRVPVLVIHSREDAMVPFEHGVTLFEAANRPRHFVEIQGGHNDGFRLSKETYVEGVDTWLTGILGPRPIRAGGSGQGSPTTVFPTLVDGPAD